MRRDKLRTVDQSTAVADVIASEVINGEVRINLGYTAQDNKGIGQGSPGWWGTDGFVSVPNDPTLAGACMAWFVQDGNNKRILGYRDNRYASKLATMQPGDRGIITDGEARFIIKQAEDSVSLYTVDQTTDTDMICTLNGKNGIGELRVGGSSVKVEDQKITFIAAGGKAIMTLDADGLQVDGNNCRFAVQSGHLGSLTPTIPGVPPPVGAASVLVGPTGLAGIGSSKWTCTIVYLLVWLAALVETVRS